MLVDRQKSLLKTQMRYEKGEEPEEEKGRTFRLDEPSIAACVVQTNAPHICLDVDDDSNYSPSFSSTIRKSMLCVPIQSGDIAIGVINADSDQLGFFNEEHAQILSRLATVVGFAVERANLIAALQDLSGAVGDREKLLSSIAEGVSQLMHVPATLVWLRDDRTFYLTVEASIGIEEDYLSAFRLDIADPFVQKCVGIFRSEKQPLYAASVQEIEEHLFAKARELDFSSVVSVPLLVGDELLGLIGAYTHEPRQFSGWSTQLVVTFAEQAATALDNTRLAAVKEQRLVLLEKEQQSLREILLGMESALDLDTILELILQEGIMKGLAPKVVSANTMLFNREKRALEMITLDAPELNGLAKLMKKQRLFKPGEGIAGHVFVSKEDYNCPDIRNDPLFAPVEHDPHKRALLSVPILSGKTAMGVLNADGGRIDCFAQDDTLWLTTLANHAAIAIERVALLESLKELKENITHEERLVERIAAGVCDLLYVEGALVWLPEGENEALTVKVSEGVTLEEVAGWQLGKDSGFVQKSLQLFEEARRPLMMWRAGYDPHFPYYETADSLGIVSMLTLPLLTERGLQGLVTAFSGEIREFTPRQRDVVRAYAEQAAIAIEDARLHRETQQRLRVMQDLRDTYLDVTSQVELSTVLKSIVERAVVLLKAKGGLAYLFNEATEELEVAVSHGLGKDYRGFTLMPGEGLSGKVYDSGKAIILNDYDSWPGRSPKWEGEGITAIIGVPLTRGATVIGVINVIDDKAKRAFTQDDLNFLALFAQQASVAVEIAQQREEQLATQAVAWMAIWGFGVSHVAVQKGAAIETGVDNLRYLFRNLPWDQEAKQLQFEIQETLTDIETAANEIQSMPIPRQIAIKPEHAPESIPIDAELTSEINRLCRRRSDITFRFDLKCPDLRARIGQGWLKIVLNSLVSNALEMMPEGGILSVSSERQDGLAEVKIADTGIGIPARVLPYFLKGRIPKEEDERGTGMGVLMARFILRQHGGDLRLLWTREGEGTALSMTIPIAKDRI
jgi:GAF domain-containing protein